MVDREAAPLPPRRRQQRQLNSPGDIEHIQSVLHGAPGELGSVPSATVASNAGDAGRRRHARPRPPPPRSSAPPDISRFAVPGPRSTARALHCQACDCFVPVPASSSSSSSSSPSSPSSSSSLPASWISHVAGIRHSRAALGAAMSGGVPGSAVAVSVFEDRHQQQGQQQRRATPGGGGGGGGEEPPSASRLRTACLKELLRHSGVTDGGRELAERFSPPNFRAALTALHSALGRWLEEADAQAEAQAQAGGGGGAAQQEREAVLALRLDGASPALVAVVACRLGGGFRDGPGEADGGAGDRIRSDGGAGGGSAGGGGVGGGGDRPLPSLLLSIQLGRVHERDLPAVTAACAVLARSLAANAGLRQLSLDGGQLARGSPAGEGQRQRLWGLVAGELVRSLRSNDALESVKVSLPRGHLRAEDARELRAAAAAAREARRLAFLSAAHPRCWSPRRGGGVSPLSSLPMDLMVVIAAMGIRRRSPCRVEVEEV